jgi:hypothetical protein
MNKALEILIDERDGVRAALEEIEAAIAALASSEPVVAAKLGGMEAQEESCRPDHYCLGTRVVLNRSGEPGEVIGVAFFTRRPPANYVEYVDAYGRQCAGWFDTEALRSA